MNARALVALALWILPVSVLAWAGQGHRLTGAIAEHLLKVQDPQALSQTRRLLGGISLRDAAVWADCAKGIDTEHEYVYKDAGRYKECRPFETAAGIDAMRDFVLRNQLHCKSSELPGSCHKHYHYTDVPIDAAHYDRRLIGTRADDLVGATQALIAYLIDAESPEVVHVANRREALLLLTHYVGDLHQPLHVGDVYLDNEAHILNGEDLDKTDGVSSTQGGNRLVIASNGRNLHQFWDELPVQAQRQFNPRQLTLLAFRVVQSPGQVQSWAALWADDTLALARQAYRRVRLTAQRTKTYSVSLTQGYRQFVETSQRQQMAKAGARLAALLRALAAINGLRSQSSR